MSCSESGSPRSSNPEGTAIAGSPARFAGTVKMSDRYMASGSSTFSPSAKAAVGLVGITSRSTRCEGGRELPPQAAPNAARPPVVGVVVTRREREGAEHDAPLDLGAEALARGCRGRGSSRSGRSTAPAVAHAVEAGQVRARPRCWRSRSRPRSPPAGWGSRPRPSSAPSAREPRERSPASRRARRRPAPAVSTSRTTPTRRPAIPSLEARRGSHPPGARRLVASRGSAPAITLERQRRVAHRAGDRPDLVERGGEGDQAVARHPAVGRLEPDHAAERRRLADRAAGVGAERQRHAAGRHRRRRAAARAAGHRVEVPGIARHLERRVLARRAHRELVEVGLAERAPRRRRAGARPRSRCRARRSPRGCASRRSGGGRSSDEVVLERHRHAGERPEPLARVAAPIDLRRPLAAPRRRSSRR